MGDRNSWLSREGSINGLFPSMRKKKGKNRVIPSSHVEEGQNLKIASELNAYKAIVNEENKIKDKLLNELSERCSKAETRVEELLMEKARVERELGKLKFSVADQTRKDKNDLESMQEELYAAKAKLQEELEKNEVQSTQLLNVSKKLNDFQGFQQSAKQQATQYIQHLENQLRAQQEELAGLYNLREEYEAQIAALQQQQGQIAMDVQQTGQLEQERDNLHVENTQLNATIQSLLAENDRLRAANAQITEKLQDEEATLENNRRRAEGQTERIKAQEKAIKDAEKLQEEAEAKAARLVDQLKVSNKKNGFLVQKADALQKKYDDKEKEANELRNKLEELTKKYKVAKERLQYIKYTSANDGGGCGVPIGNNNNNNDEDDHTPGDNTNVAVRGGLPFGNGTCKSRPFASKRNSAPPSSSERTEDHPSATATLASRRKQEVDPAAAHDSDAPAWMRF